MNCTRAGWMGLNIWIIPYYSFITQWSILNNVQEPINRLHYFLGLLSFGFVELLLTGQCLILHSSLLASLVYRLKLRTVNTVWSDQKQRGFLCDPTCTVKQSKQMSFSRNVLTFPFSKCGTLSPRQTSSCRKCVAVTCVCQINEEQCFPLFTTVT